MKNSNVTGKKYNSLTKKSKKNNIKKIKYKTKYVYL